MSPKMATCMLVLTSSLVCTDKAGGFRLSSCGVLLEVTWMSIKMLLVELAQELDYGTSLYLESKLGKPIPNHKFRLNTQLDFLKVLRKEIESLCINNFVSIQSLILVCCKSSYLYNL